ncbi:MAG: hypothetical protein ACE5EE_10545 [Fidelibacterota bacterium]
MIIQPHLLYIILSLLLGMVISILFIKMIKKRRASLNKEILLSESSSMFFVPTSKYNGTLAMVVKNVLPPSMRRTHDMTGKQALLFKMKREDLKIDGWASDGHIRGEYHELGNERYYVYVQPMRKGRRGIELEDYLTSRASEKIVATSSLIEKI